MFVFQWDGVLESFFILSCLTKEDRGRVVGAPVSKTDMRPEGKGVGGFVNMEVMVCCHLTPALG